MKEFFKNTLTAFLVKTKKISKRLKRSYKKIKYLDRIEAKFFTGITILSLFCLFIGGTYSYFNFSTHLPSSFITIANLKYTLTSENERFQNNSITIEPGEILELTLDLKSLNEKNSKYALNYSSNNTNIKVLYIEKSEQNVIGEIGTRNSIINIKIAIENASEEAGTVNFELKGGFLKNTLTTNIVEEFIDGLKVVFNPNGGVINTSEIHLEKDKEFYGELPIPEKNGNVFLGWFTENTKGTRVKSTDKITFRGRQTLFAHWGQNSSSEELVQFMNLNVKEGNPNFASVAPSVAEYRDDGFTEEIDFYNLANSYIYSDTYEFNPVGENFGGAVYEPSITGTYTLINPKTCTTKEECASVLKGKYIVSKFGGKDTTTNKNTIYLVDEQTTAERLYFKTSQKSIVSYDEASNGIWSMEDDYGTSYYFRGDIKNNYIKFAELYWRILRINGDGSIRLVYDGTIAHANGEPSDDRILANEYWIYHNFSYSQGNDNKFLGYMFGGNTNNASSKRVEYGSEGYASPENSLYNQTSSDMKLILEDWYRIKIQDKDYSIYVEDQPFCNDRSILGVSDDEASNYGYGKISTSYAPQRRVRTTPISPTLKCPSINDSFTENKSQQGNGKLTNPIGLLSADEVGLAGALLASNHENDKYYLYKGNKYWTMSPHSYGYLYVVLENGLLSANPGSVYYNTSNGVVPVISISSAYFKTLTGDGTMDNPYREEGIEP